VSIASVQDGGDGAGKKLSIGVSISEEEDILWRQEENGSCMLYASYLLVTLRPLLIFMAYTTYSVDFR